MKGESRKRPAAAMTSHNLPVAGQKSKAEEMRSELFRRHQPQHGKEMEALLGAKPTDVLIDLQQHRDKVCAEIDDLIRQLNQEAPLTDEELAKLNDQVNQKFQLRWSIEDDIRTATRGAQDFAFSGDRGQVRFFGQAKKLRQTGAGSPRPIDPKTVLADFRKTRTSAEEKEDSLEATIAKAIAQQPSVRQKKALFDDDSSSSEE